MFSIFEYSFMVRAFEAGLITAVVAPCIGMFLVTRRYSFLADTLAHVSLAGVAVAALVGWNPIFTAMGASILTSLSVEQLRRRKILGESALTLFLSGGLALASVLLSIGRGRTVNVGSLLFGSITTVTPNDVILIALLGAAVLLTIYFLYQSLFAVSYDEVLAEASGLPVRLLNHVLIILAAVTVSLTMRVMGVLLVGSLMVIPVITAMQFRKGFRTTLLMAVGCSVLSVFSGLIMSYYVGTASGGTIVLIAIGFFSVSLLWKLRSEA